MSKTRIFHWRVARENDHIRTACGELTKDYYYSISWLSTDAQACPKCLQVAKYFATADAWCDIPDQPTNQAAKQLSLSNSPNSDITPPSSISRPFTPEEFLSWLRWNETHGEVSLGEIITEAEYMFGFRDARLDLAR